MQLQTEKKVKSNISSYLQLLWIFSLQLLFAFSKFSTVSLYHFYDQKYSNLHLRKKKHTHMKLPFLIIPIFHHSCSCHGEFHLFPMLLFQTRSYTLPCLFPPCSLCLESFCSYWEQIQGGRIFRYSRLAPPAKAMGRWREGTLGAEQDRGTT